MDFLLDNRPLRLLTTKGSVYSVCDYDRLIAHLNEVGFFDADANLLFPTLLTLEFIGIKLERIARPTLNVDAFPRMITDRVRSVFEYAYDFFSDTADLTMSSLMEKLEKQIGFQRSGRHSMRIYRNIETRLQSPGFHDEVCTALALDFVSAIDMGGFELPEKEKQVLARNLSYDDRMVQSNSFLLSWILGLRESLPVPVTAVRIANKICTHAMHSNLSIEVDGKIEKLKDAFEFRAKSDGADMEYIDFALLGCSGRSVMSVTFDCYDKAALRMGAIRWLYKNALTALPGTKVSAAHARLIDGQVLHFSNRGIQRIRAGNLGAVDLKIIGL